MGQKIFIKWDKENSYIYDRNGGYMGRLLDEDNKGKEFLLVVKCGHCGTGYYIPVIFSCYSKDKETAIQRIKGMPRVKGDQDDFLLDCFEVSKAESYLVKAINDHDPYLCGGPNEEYDEVRKCARRCMQDARVKQILKDNEGISDEELSRIIKTADMFKERYVLQRYFGPMIRNGELYHLNKYSRKQMLEEYFAHSVLRLGIQGGDVYFLSMLYQIYGKNNPLGLVYDNGKFLYKNEYGKVFTYEINDIYMGKLIESGVFERDKESEKAEFFSGREIKKESAIDRFNRRRKASSSSQKNSEKPESEEPDSEGPGMQ